MWDKLRYWLFSRKQRQQPARNVQFPVYDKVQTILLIYDSDIMEKNADIRTLTGRLMQDGKQVYWLGYVARKDVQSPLLPQSRMLGLKDHNFLHILRKDVQQDIAKDEYDLLIDLTEQPCLPLHYVALMARCRFKAGKHIVEGLHDLDIDMPATESHIPLFEQIIHYLTTIQSHDIKV